MRTEGQVSAGTAPRCSLDEIRVKSRDQSRELTVGTVEVSFLWATAKTV